jgi:hypothetical protein
MNKITITLVLVVLAAAIAGGYFYPKLGLGTSSVAGSSFSTPKFYGVAVNLANPGANGTSTSLTNTDGNDRYVTGYRIACQGVGTSKTAYTGAGLAALTAKIGTTTTSAPATFATDVGVNPGGWTVSTSTVNSGVASSTSQVGNGALWRTGEIMTFAFNATNTAVCTVGVDAVGA